MVWWACAAALSVVEQGGMQEIPQVMGFTSGELSPWLSTRYDLQAYLRGAAKLSNVLTLPYGGLKRRPGTVYVGASGATGSTAVKLFAFCYSASEALMLEFFSGGMRVYRNGSLLYYDGAPYVLKTPWLAPAKVRSLRFTQINDVVCVTCPVHQPMLLKRLDDTNWRCEPLVPEPYPRETYTQQSDALHVEMEQGGTHARLRLDAGSSRRFLASMAGLEYVMADAPVPTVTLFRGEEFDRQQLADFAEFYKYTIPVGTGGYVKNTAGNLYRYYTCIREFNATHFNGSTDPDDYPHFFLPGFMWLNSAGEPYEVCADWEIRTYGEWNATWELWRSYDTPTAGSDYGLWQWTRIRTFSQSDFAERQNWALSGSEPYPCRMVLVLRESQALSIDPMLHFCAPGGMREYKFRIVSVSDARSARAELVSRYLGQSKSFTTRSWSFGAMGALMYYPRFSAFCQGRLWFGGIPGLPTTLLASSVDDFTDFHIGSGDADALHLTLSTDNQSRICWLCAARELLLGTADSEWVLTPSSGNALTAANAAFRRQTSVGSAELPPLTIENTVLFVQRGGKRLREISYKLENDGFAVSDISLLAEHLLRPGVQECCIQRGADFYVWLLLQDGSVAVLTLNLEQKVTAWQRMDFGARRVLQIAAIPAADGGDDEVWLLIQNPANGALSLERICAASVFGDGFVRATPDAAGWVRGLAHLAGQTVCYAPAGELALSSATYGRVGDDGTLRINASTGEGAYDIALPYVSELQTLPLESQLSFNSVRQLSRVRLRLLESDLNFSYRCSNSERWEHYTPATDRLSTPYSGSLRLPMMPRPGVEQGFCLRYSGMGDLRLLSMTIEVDYHGK